VTLDSQGAAFGQHFFGESENFFAKYHAQQFQIQNDFTPFQRSPELSKIVKFSWCKAFRAIKF